MGSIAAVGSTALQPFVDAAAKAYVARCMGAQIAVRGGGSGTGLLGAQRGQATVEMASVANIQIGASDIFAEEQRSNVQDTKIVPTQLTDFQVVVQGFAVVVNPRNPVVSLTQEQLIRIFTGQVTNFRDVGGPDSAISVVNRAAGSGTRSTFERYALRGQAASGGREVDGSGDVAKAVSDNAGAISYLALTYLVSNPNLKTVLFNGRDPSVENMSDDSYPIWSYGHLYTNRMPAGLTQSFLDYLLSDDVQTTLVPQLGYIPVSRVKARKTPV